MKIFVATVFNKIYILCAVNISSARSKLENAGVYNSAIEEVKLTQIKEITITPTVTVNYA